MQPPSGHLTLIDRLVRPARSAVSAAFSVFGVRLNGSGESARLPPEWGPDDRRQKDRRKDERRRDESVLLDAHGSLRAGNPNRTLRVLVEWLASRGDQQEDFDWICSRISSWTDTRQITRLTQERIARLLILKRSDEVLELMVRRLTADPQFRPKSAADTLLVAQLAANSDHLRLTRALLSDFAARFKGDPRIPAAYALKQRLSRSATATEKSA